MSASTPISVFDMLKIGVGPSSSHTLGPWMAARRLIADLAATGRLDEVASVRVDLFGSLAKTGRGHGTGVAIMMGLGGHHPETCDVDLIPRLGSQVLASGRLILGGVHPVAFERERDIVFRAGESLATHPNGMRFTVGLTTGDTVVQTSYSVGGGFVVHDGEPPADESARPPRLPHPIETAADLERWCTVGRRPISEVVRDNERAWRSDAAIDARLLRIRDVMLECIFRGCSTRGTLPGGLGVTRRAAPLHDSLLAPTTTFGSPAQWFDAVRAQRAGFGETVRWISCFALAVNEENAAFGRVVTAPTNGAAGVIPAVMFHHLATLGHDEPVDGASDGAADMDLDAEAIRFLLVAAEIGSIFKKGATISAALGGCQAEIGVSSAMAAAALTECRGGTPSQALMAAEIAMEHHLGMTCDPIGGLVQVPCIERNAMGAMKAISAAHLALVSSAELARVSLDDVIDTMWRTAQDMSVNYKETADGGLATRIAVNVVEC